MSFPSPFVIPNIYDDPGSVTFNTVGSHSFIVPRYRNSLTIQAWGGGGGAGIIFPDNPFPGEAGEDSVILTLRAGGGGRGGAPGPGVGGIASGGTINSNGGNASGVRGGNSPNGGTGGNGSDGNPPGGGGGGYDTFGVGGGAGAYVRRDYAKGILTAGLVASLTVGAGGLGAFSWEGGGNGARGEIRINWT